MISRSFVEMTSVNAKPGRENGIECNEKLLMKTCVLSAFLYERVGQRLSTPSAGEPIYSVISFLSTQEIIDPGESTKESCANIRCVGNDCNSYGEKCESLFSRLSLTPRTLDQMQ